VIRIKSIIKSPYNLLCSDMGHNSADHSMSPPNISLPLVLKSQWQATSEKRAATHGLQPAAREWITAPQEPALCFQDTLLLADRLEVMPGPILSSVTHVREMG
jgi:hypothetical protein